jgi:hypothetical protein
VRAAARWLATNAPRSLATGEGRERINTALDVVHYASQGLLRVRDLASGDPTPLGFDVGGDLVDVTASWDEPDHGQDLEHEHDAERPTARRRRQP